MDYLDAVAFVERRARPVGAAHHFAVEFDGEPFRRKCELLDERRERRPVRHFDRFVVDPDLQACGNPFALTTDE